MRRCRSGRASADGRPASPASSFPHSPASPAHPVPPDRGRTAPAPGRRPGRAASSRFHPASDWFRVVRHPTLSYPRNRSGRPAASSRTRRPVPRSRFSGWSTNFSRRRTPGRAPRFSRGRASRRPPGSPRQSLRNRSASPAGRQTVSDSFNHLNQASQPGQPQACVHSLPRSLSTNLRSSPCREPQWPSA